MRETSLAVKYRSLFQVILLLLITAVANAQTIPQVNNIPWYEFSKKLSVGERLKLPQDTLSLGSGSIRDTTGLIAMKNGKVYVLVDSAWSEIGGARLSGDTLFIGSDTIQLYQPSPGTVYIDGAYTLTDTADNFIVTTTGVTVSFPDPASFEGREIKLTHRAFSGTADNTNGINFGGAFIPVLFASNTPMGGQAIWTTATYTSDGSYWRMGSRSHMTYVENAAGTGIELGKFSGGVNYSSNGAVRLGTIKRLKSSDGSITILNMGDSIDIVSGFNFSNGLIKIGNTIKLGGGLTEHTTLMNYGYNFNISAWLGDTLKIGAEGYGSSSSITATNYLTILPRQKYIIIQNEANSVDDIDRFPRIQIGVQRRLGEYSRKAKYAAVIESFTYSGNNANPAVDSNRNKPFMIVTTGFNGAAGGAGDIILRPGVTTGLGSNYDNRYGNFHVKLEPSGTGTVKTPYKAGAITDSVMMWRASDSSLRMASAAIFGSGDVTTAQLADTANAIRTDLGADISYDFGTQTDVSKQIGAVINPALIKFKTINLVTTGGLRRTYGADNTDSLTATIDLPDQAGHNGHVLTSNGTTADWQAASGGITALTGDVTASGTGSVAATIANNAVTNAKMATVATATIKGRTTAGTGDPEDLTASQVRSLLSLQLPATWHIVEDFVNGAGSSFSASVGNGGGAFNIPILATDQVGVFRFNTGSSSAAAYSIASTYDNSFTFNSNTYTMDVKDITLNTLNTTTDSTQYLVGFFDNLFSNGNPVDGAYLMYSSTGANWKAVTVSNSTFTYTATDIPAAVGIANSIDIEIRANSTQVLFYINGILKATHTTNIPTGLTRTFSMGAGVKKKLGTAERTMEIDRILFKIN